MWEPDPRHAERAIRELDLVMGGSSSGVTPGIKDDSKDSGVKEGKTVEEHPCKQCSMIHAYGGGPVAPLAHG